MLNIQVHGRQIKHMRFLLAGRGGWLVLLGKQEPDPEAGFLHLHVCLLLVILFAAKKTLPLYRQRKCGVFSRVTVPVPGTITFYITFCAVGHLFSILFVSPSRCEFPWVFEGR